MSFVTALPLVLAAAAVWYEVPFHGTTIRLPPGIAAALLPAIIVVFLFWARLCRSVQKVTKHVVVERAVPYEKTVVVESPPQLIEVPVYVPVVIRPGEQATLLEQDTTPIAIPAPQVEPSNELDGLPIVDTGKNKRKWR